MLDFGCGMGTVAYYTAKTDSWTIDLPGYFRKMVKCLSQDIASPWQCRLSAMGTPVLAEESFDLIYCHFVLHDIAEGELERVIPELVKSLKSGGVLVFANR